jgi:glutathione S-transferase
MSIIVTAFENAPDGGKALARDMPVRWALEEAGVVYDVRRLSFGALKEPAHRALQPFGQIPTYEEDGLVLFESGAIVLYIAQRHGALLHRDDIGRARATAWIFAAINTIEPPVFERGLASILERDEPWYDRRRLMLEERIRARLRDLSARLAQAQWLEGTFNAGDLMMVATLRRLHGTGLLEEFPLIAAYVARGEARPAFQKAFAAQR